MQSAKSLRMDFPVRTGGATDFFGQVRLWVKRTPAGSLNRKIRGIDSARATFYSGFTALQISSQR
jgi:hypothetical protein